MTSSPFPAGADPWLYADFARMESKRTEDLEDVTLLGGAVNQGPSSGWQHP